MNESQRRQIEEARRESIEKSYCIDATGNKSMGHSMPMHMEVEKVEHRNEAPIYQKD
jgi:hypothetical protein